MKKIASVLLITLLLVVKTFAQRDVQLVTSQLGFKPASPKTITFFARNAPDIKLPDKIAFYITNVGWRRSRAASSLQQGIWQPVPFRFPIDISKGNYKSPDGECLYKGNLINLRPFGTKFPCISEQSALGS